MMFVLPLRRDGTWLRWEALTLATPSLGVTPLRTLDTVGPPGPHRPTWTTTQNRMTQASPTAWYLGTLALAALQAWLIDYAHPQSKQH